MNPSTTKPETLGETEGLVKKEEVPEITATETFEKELAQIKENGKEIKGQNNRNFYKSIVERIENNVKVLAELRQEHAALRERLNELTDSPVSGKHDLQHDIKQLKKQVNNIQRNIDNVTNAKKVAISRQKELSLILRNFDDAEKQQSPESTKITALKNKLDKTNIKINEAKHIIKMYERVITKFEKQKIHWNPLVNAKQEELQKQERDLDELKLIKGESEYSKNSAKQKYNEEFERIKSAREKRKNLIQRKTRELDKEVYNQIELTPNDSRRIRPQQTLGSQNSAIIKSKQNKAQREAKEEKIRQLNAKLDQCQEAFGTRDPVEIDRIIKERENTSKSLNEQIEVIQKDIENLKVTADKLRMEVEEEEYTHASGVGGSRLLSEGRHLQDKKEKELAELKRSIEAFERHQKNVTSGVQHLTEIISLVSQPNEAPTDIMKIFDFVQERVDQVLKILSEEDGDLETVINKQVLSDVRQQGSLDIEHVDSSKRIQKKATDGFTFKRPPKDTKNEETSRVLTRQQIKLIAKQQASNAPQKKLPALK